MQFDWQTIVALFIVILAVFALMRQCLEGKGSAGCGSSCGGCSRQSSDRKQLLQLAGHKSLNKPARNSSDL
jgi:hypothetical protein